MASFASRRHIERNVRIHDRVAPSYEQTHDEIFNDVEQSRLRNALTRAAQQIRSSAAQPRALDFGCGSGNLTRHLLDLGFEVVAADVSRGFLAMVERRYAGRPVSTFQLNGESLAGLADGTFDLVAAYSVLHHVPDYLGALSEMARVTKRGGVIYLDHEHSPGYWDDNPTYKSFIGEARRFNWRKFLEPHNYYGKLRRLLIDPRYSNEGDIHVWPDDHIDWPAVEAQLHSDGFETLFAEDYLAYRGDYRREVYERYQGRCSDMRVTALRKLG
jgi:ubiquinone/menaquinone biosynthesis C-methylase UbiE